MVLADRFRELAHDKGMNIKEFSSFLGVSERTVQNYLAEVSLPNGRFLADLTEKTGASASWVLTGSGPKYLGNEHQNLHVETARFVPVTRFTVEASAGHGSLVQDETGSGTYAYNRAFLERRGLKAENLAVISVKGDSMLPDLHDGDLILIDRGEAAPDAVREGAIYVVQYDNGLFVKRIQIAPGRRLMLASSNPAYPPIMVDGTDMDSVKIVGRVVNSTREW